jgi:G3E family GTPase
LQQWKGPDLLRMKGIVNVETLPGPLVIQGVQHILYPSLALKAWPSDDRRTRIVVIVRNIDKAMVRQTLGLLTGAAPIAPRSRSEQSDVVAL